MEIKNIRLDLAKRFLSAVLIVAAMLACLFFSSTTNAATVVSTGNTYSDSDGNTWTYSIYDDDTANITGYAIHSSTVSVPETISGLSVTSISQDDEHTVSVSSIDSLYINTSTLAQQVFRGIGVSIDKLTIGNDVKNFGMGGQFYGLTIGTVYFNADNANNTDTSATAGVFYQCTVGKIIFKDGINRVPSRLCYGITKLEQDEMTINAKYIGLDAFNSGSGKVKIGTLTIGENVTSVGDYGFKQATITTLNFNATSATRYGSGNLGFFDSAKIGTLNIGSDVTKIPTTCFFNAYLTQDELTVNAASIGSDAFCSSNIKIGTLTIGEDVTTFEAAGENFGKTTIGKVKFNATQSIISSTVMVYGIFSSATIDEISIGENVNYIPAYLFSEATFNGSEIVIPESVVNIRTKAFSLSSQPNLSTVKVYSITKSGSNNIGYSVLSYDTLYIHDESDWYSAFTTETYHAGITIHSLCEDYYEDFSVSVTCTTDGTAGKRCSVCGHEKDVTTVAALGHDFSGDWIYDDVIIQNYPDETDTNGHRYHKCSRCDVIGDDEYHINPYVKIYGYILEEEAPDPWYTVEDDSDLWVEGFYTSDEVGNSTVGTYDIHLKIPGLDTGKIKLSGSYSDETGFVLKDLDASRTPTILHDDGTDSVRIVQRAYINMHASSSYPTEFTNIRAHKPAILILPVRVKWGFASWTNYVSFSGLEYGSTFHFDAKEALSEKAGWKFEYGTDYSKVYDLKYATKDNLTSSDSYSATASEPYDDTKVKFYYSSDFENWSETSPDYTTSGSYTLYIKLAGTNLFSGISKVGLKFNFDGEPIDARLKNQTVTYTGREQHISSESDYWDPALPSGVTVKFLDDNGSTYAYSSAPAYKDVGEYTIYYQLSGTNYATYNGTATFTIEGVATPTARLKDQEVVYNGAYHYVSIAADYWDPALDDKWGVLFKLDGMSDYTSPHSDDYEDVGVYTVPYKVYYKSNSLLPSYTGTMKFTIRPGTFSEITFSDREVYYSGFEYSLSRPSGIPYYADVAYSEDGVTWSDDIPEYTDIGNYTVYAKVYAEGYEDYTTSATLKILSPLEPEARLKDETVPYTGSEQSINVDDSAWDPVKDSLTYVRFSWDGGANYNKMSPDKHTDTGNYTVYYMLGKWDSRYGNYYGTATFTIGNLTPIDARLSDQTVTYNGSPQRMDHVSAASWVPAKDSGTQVMFSTDEGVTYSSENPPYYTNVGEYTVYYELSKTLYETYRGTATFKIVTGVMSGIAFDDDEVDYDGNPHSLNPPNGTPDGATIQYSTDGVNWTDEVPEFTEIGDYTVYVKVSADGYEDYTDSATLKINKGTMGDIYMPTESRVYTGEELHHSGDLRGMIPIGSTITYSDEEDGTYGDVPCWVDLGSYTIYWKITNPNYHDKTGTGTFNITKPPLHGISLDNVEVDYDGEPHTVGEIEGDIPDGSIITWGEDNEDFSDEKPSYVDAGSYVIYFMITNDEYRDYVDSAILTINKIAMEGLTVSDIEVDYDGDLHTVDDVEGDIPDGSDIFWSSDGNNYSEDKPEYSESGSYRIYFKVVNPNYIDYVGSATLRIIPPVSATYTVSFFEAEDFGGDLLITANVRDGGSLIMPPNPTHKGYDFSGWLSGNNSYAVNASITVVSDMKIYASYHANNDNDDDKKPEEPVPVITEPVVEIPEEPDEPVSKNETPIVSDDSLDGNEKDETEDDPPKPKEKPDDQLEDKTPDEVETTEDLIGTPIKGQDDIMEEIEESEDDESSPLVAIAVSIVGGAGAFFFFLFWWRRRKVKGKVLDEDGNPAAGLRVTLQGKDNLETDSDTKGRFIFRNVKSDNHTLTIFDDDSRKIFVCQIYTDAKDDEEIFTIITDETKSVRLERRGNLYRVDLEM